jgi:hypothetical protein
MEQRKDRPAIDIRNFVRKYIETIPSHEFDALLNEISYLDHYRTIELRKAYVHHLDDVIDKAIVFYKPGILYRKSFVTEDHTMKIDLLDFGAETFYREKLVFPNKKIKVLLHVFKKKEDAENFLVEKLCYFRKSSEA